MLVMLMSHPLRQTVTRLDQKLVAFFERPGPRRSAEMLLVIVQHLESGFFFPFRLLTVPARFFLESRHEKNVRHHR